MQQYKILKRIMIKIKHISYYKLELAVAENTMEITQLNILLKMVNLMDFIGIKAVFGKF